jgi:hypothetical protein
MENVEDERRCGGRKREMKREEGRSRDFEMRWNNEDSVLPPVEGAQGEREETSEPGRGRQSPTNRTPPLQPSRWIAILQNK